MKAVLLLFRSAFSVAVLLLTCSAASAAFPRIGLETVTEGELLAPVAITNAGDGSGRLFIVDQRGKIFIIDNGALLATPLLDISAKLVPERAGFDERGLLGLAFHPDPNPGTGLGSGKFYVYYSAPSPNAPGIAEDPVDHMSVVAEFSFSAGDANLADPASERILLTVDQPQFNHDAGQLAFGPDDNLLYIAFGDGGSGDDNNAGHTGGSADRPSGGLGNSQDRTKLLGKILRIDPLGNDGPGGQYGIPDGNPFVGEGGGVREEIYAYGLRNPWRFSFDDGPGGTGRLFCADVGQREIEEVNLIVSGGNYGWRNKEGTFDFDATAPGVGPFIDPIAQYAHPTTEVGLPKIGLSVTGGYVYRGSAIPGMVGRYLFADWSNSFGAPGGTLLGLTEDGGEFTLSVLDVAGGNPIPYYLAALGEDEDGELYVAAKRTLAPSALDPDTNLPTGAVFKIVSGAPGPIAQTTTIEPVKDNTMYSEGNQSNGTGQFLFSGRTNQGPLRRALLEFDVAGSVPAGATIDAATVSLRMNKTIVGAVNNHLHRVDRTWGEAGSNASGDEGQGIAAQPGDATWNFNLFNTDSWTNPGGDFAATPSATASVNATGTYSWTSPALAADVQAFLDAPASNFGWVLLGGESTLSAKRFDSREATSATNRPKLKIDYKSTPVAPDNFQRWSEKFFDQGEQIDLAADIDGDQIVAILEYSADLDPKTLTPLTDLYTSRSIPAAAGDLLQFTFRRDPRAADLIYRIEESDDLLVWTTVAESIAGSPVRGSGVVSDHPVVSAPPLRETTVQKPIATGSRGFLRLVVIQMP